MFTGLIEAVGQVVRREEKASGVSGVRLGVGTPLAGELQAGDSLAVNGVCLTVVGVSGGEVAFDVGPETVRITTLGSIHERQLVNLERPMSAAGRFGGHFVLGHVDGTGVVENARADGDAHWITIAFPESLSPLLIAKGSIAVDGVSLTIAGLREGVFDVMIIPYTWEHTSLRTVQPGGAVNLECDVIGKYVARTMELAGSRPAGGTASM
jgi:riboflavin synthase